MPKRQVGAARFNQCDAVGCIAMPRNVMQFNAAQRSVVRANGMWPNGMKLLCHLLNTPAPPSTVPPLSMTCKRRRPI